MIEVNRGGRRADGREVDDGAFPDAAGESLSPVLIGRLSGALWVACGLLVVATMPIVSFPPGANARGVVLMGAIAVCCGIGIWLLPWDAWGRSATLWIVPLAFAAIALFSSFSRDEGSLASLFYLVTFVWIGLAHRPGTSLLFAPLVALAYVAPLWADGDLHRGFGVASVVYAVPCCIVVGETVAWVSARLRRSEVALADAEARFRNAFEFAPIGMAMATIDGCLSRVNRAFADVIGYQPEDLAGVPLRDITHAEDRDLSLSEFEACVAGAVDRYQIEKRYRHAEGHDVWVLVSVSCVRDPQGAPLYLIGQLEDITERRALQDRLTHAAVHDLLTGVPNRVLFMDRMELALQRCQREHHVIAVMFLDIDRFKLINDSLGHDAGDRLLQRVAQRLQQTLRSGDTLARFGGDEFTVLCEVMDESQAVEIAQRMVKAMEQPLDTLGSEVFVSASIGIALAATGKESGSELLRSADVAMYRAKMLGPGHIEVYRASDDVSHLHRLRMSTELHGALDRDELELHYQPIVELHNSTLVGVEALVRWRHPSRGLLAPGEFIPLAEDTGLIVPLGEWVLNEACRQTVIWEQRRTAVGLDEARLNVSVNVSAHQLLDPAFPQHVRSAIDGSGINPERLWLEITESTLMSNSEEVMGTLQDLRSLGLHLEIDDFGTGYSSLSRLKLFPVETLKIDRSFIDEIDNDLGDVAIVRAIIALGESLRLSVIAEGTERRSQVETLTQLGCYLTQGYLYGRPMPAKLIEPFPADDLSNWMEALQSSTA